MKVRPCLMWSVCVNLLLAAAVIRAVRGRTGPGEVSPASGHITNRVVRARPGTNPAAPSVVTVGAPFHWREVESTDYRVYVGNLRAIGCPEATIRDIIVADVNELFTGRIRELADGITDRFWDMMLKPKEFERIAEEKLKEVHLLEAARTEIFEELLGEKNPGAEWQEAEERMEERANREHTFDFLPGGKRAQLLEMLDRFQAARRELEQEGATLTQDERRRKARELNAEEERQLQALLTAQEFDEYKLRTSPAADFRSQLVDFDATEEELRAIARARKNLEEARAALNRKDADYKAQLSRMRTQTDEQISQLLGAERFAAYQRASDDAYQQTLRITDRFELPSETAVQVYQMRKEAEAQARIIRNDANRTVEERQAILKALQAETEKSISAVLGSKAFAAYQHHGDGWLSRFADGVQRR